MPRLCLKMSLWVGLVPLALLAGLPAARAQGGKATPVRVTTVDGVDLHGSFYAGSKKSPPTVLILHALGESSQKKGYRDLAEDLQKNGYAVMLFDFRGHGKSTSVDPQKFWMFLPNAGAGGKGAVGKADSIDFKGFAKNYYPVLINDIAAVRGFLDRKNDTGECNTSSLIVVGAETGATLGSIWLNSEWHRYKIIQPMMFGGLAQPSPTPEGKDIVACIWLSLTSTLGGQPITPATVLDTPVRVGGTSTLFIYGDGDTKGKQLAQGTEKRLKGSGKDSKTKYTGAVPIKQTKLTGINLLQKGLPTEKAIADYVENVVAEKGNEWVERDFRKSQYIWRRPGAQPQLIKNPNDTNLMFSDYQGFMGR